MVTTVKVAEIDLFLKDVSNFQYTSCYCEENIYHLCKTLSEQGLAAKDASDLFVVFISNPTQRVPFWRQRNSSREGGLCVWDYHVICIQKDLQSDISRVWDLDTTLSLPVALSKYAKGALRPEVSLEPNFRRLFRVIRAPLFLRFFASDRRHMKNREGIWLASPPPYDCIVAEDGEVHNLPEYNTTLEEQVLPTGEIALDRFQGERFGLVLSQDALLKLFGGAKTPSISCAPRLSRRNLLCHWQRTADV
ncbi:unnamed protein product [Calypogeia fissa]